MKALIEFWNRNKPIMFRTQTLSKELDTKIQQALIEHDRWTTTEQGKAELDLLFSSGRQATGAYGTSIFEEIDAGYQAQKPTVAGAEEKTVKEDKDYLGAGLNIGATPETQQTLGNLQLQQAASYDQWSKVPVAKSIIENYKRYGVGKGIKFDISAPDVETFISKFWLQNNMEKRLKDGFRDLLLDGELFWTYFVQAVEDDSFDKEYDTPVVVRRIPSTQVQAVEIDPNDYETRLSYKRVMFDPVKRTTVERIYLDISHPMGDEKKLKLPTTINKSTSQFATAADTDADVKVQMFKLGLTFDERGRVAMDSVLRWNRILVDFVYDRGRLNHLRTKVFLVETRNTKAGVAAKTSYERMPKGGMKLIQTGNTTFQMVSPNTGASDAEYDFQMISYMIASGMQMPYHVLISDASNNNYASIREAGNPWAHAVADLQDDYAEMIKVMLRYVISCGIRTGMLKSEITLEQYPGSYIGEMRRFIMHYLTDGVPPEQIITMVKEAFDTSVLQPKKVTMRTVDVPINLIFPKVVQTDPDKLAAYLKIMSELGVMSKETIMREIGLDPDIETARIEVEDQSSWDKQQERMAQQQADFGAPPEKVPGKPEAQKPPDPNSTEDQ